MLEEEILIDYLEGRLAEQERRKVERHLAGCNTCIEELLLLTEILPENALRPYEAVPFGLKQEAAMQIIAARSAVSNAWATLLLKGRRKISSYASIMVPWWNLHFEKVRGSHVIVDRDFYVTKKSFPNVEVKIEIERKGADIGDIRIFALANPTHASLLRATLYKADREVSSFLFGNRPAVFEDVSFGRYKLLFFLNGSEEGNYSFEIKESRNGR